MPIYSLAQLASHATRLAADNLTPLSIVSEYVNLAVAQVSQAAGVKHSPKEAVAFASTSTSDNRLAFPTDYDYAIGLKIGVPTSWSTATSRDTTWQPLTKEPAPWGDPYQSGQSGTPEKYGEFATWFELRPSPDSVYSTELRYMRKLSEMTASTATPNLDEQWHWGVAVKTAELLCAYLSDSTRERENARRFNTYVANMRLDQARRRMDERGMYFSSGFQRSRR